MSKAEQSDKLTQVLDAVEHPERYTDEQLRELLCDEECADYYRLLCDASSAYDEALEIDDTEINAAWQQNAGQKREKKMTFRKMVAFSTLWYFLCCHQNDTESSGNIIHNICFRQC